MTFNNTTAELLNLASAVFSSVDHGYQTWTTDPEHITSTFTLTTSGTMYVAAVKMETGVVSNIVLDMTTAGATLTAGQNFAGIYQNGVLLGSTADVTTTFTGSTGLVTLPLVNVTTVGQGLVYVAVVANGTTKPTFAAVAPSQSAAYNGGLVRHAAANTGVTTALPASLGALTANTSAFWAALS